MIVEFVICLSLTLVIALCSSFHQAYSFFLGSLIAFFPQIIFIYYVLFRKNTQKVTALYRGEGLKWLITIVLMVFVLKTAISLNMMIFFAGYFLGLFCNGIFPIFLNRQTQ
ncbi:ATP synthase subunit I [Vespertiliibacter pulmonis]|nr:ATP synthase subunit I [Vespertiliibacter pulmonis]